MYLIQGSRSVYAIETKQPTLTIAPQIAKDNLTRIPGKVYHSPGTPNDRNVINILYK